MADEVTLNDLIFLSSGHMADEVVFTLNVNGENMIFYFSEPLKEKVRNNPIKCEELARLFLGMFNATTTQEFIENGNRMTLEELNCVLYEREGIINSVSYLRKYEELKYLLDRGVDPNYYDYYGFTPLISVSWGFQKEKELDCVILLLERGANPKIKSSSGYFNGMSAIDIATGNGKYDMVNLFLKKEEDDLIIQEGLKEPSEEYFLDE